MHKLTFRLVFNSFRVKQNDNYNIRVLKGLRSKALRLINVDETWVYCYEPEESSKLSVTRVWFQETEDVQDTTLTCQGDGHGALGR